jgi:hypothetical protein
MIAILHWAMLAPGSPAHSWDNASMVQFKGVVRWLLEQRSGTPARFLLDFTERWKAFGVLKDSVYRLGLQSLSIKTISAIRRKKESNTLFLLGSGSSVNDLDDEMWDEISRQVSVGINHWTLHQFVPDIYAVETVPDQRRSEGESKDRLGLDHLNHLQILNRPEVLESEAIVICLAPRTEGERSQVLQLPDELRSRAFVYYRFTPTTRSEANIERDFARWLRFPFSTGPGVLVPDSGATLVRLLGIGLMAGFKTVVLVGIDLSTAYFWEDRKARLARREFADFPQPMKGTFHETLSVKNRPFSVITCVRAFRRIYRKKGMEIQAIQCHESLK